MSVLDCIKNRFSARKFLKKPIEEEVLHNVLEAARYSQSAKNIQNWRFIVVRDDKKKKALSVAAKGQTFVGEAPVVIVCCGLEIDYIMTCGQYSYPIDVAIAMENMALAAHESGLGTCWIGAFYEDQAKRILGIPEHDVRVVGMLVVGYPAVQAPEKRRKSLDEIITYDAW